MHTNTPWKVVNTPQSESWAIQGPENSPFVGTSVALHMSAEDAAFIVRAANGFYEMAMVISQLSDWREQFGDEHIPKHFWSDAAAVAATLRKDGAS